MSRVSRKVGFPEKWCGPIAKKPRPGVDPGHEHCDAALDGAMRVIAEMAYCLQEFIDAAEECGAPPHPEIFHRARAAIGKAKGYA